VHILCSKLRISVALSVAACSIVTVLLAAPAAPQSLPRSVLLLDQYAGSLPWVGLRNAAFRTRLNAGREVPISIYEEYLDFNRFAAPAYKESLKALFRGKYRDKPIGVIVAFGPLALEYGADIRDSLWPTRSVVFGEIAERAITRPNLPANTTGTTINITFSEMVLAARALMPDLKRIALVGDLLENLPAYRHFKEEMPAVARDLELIDLTGLAMADLQKHVARLPGQTVIAYTTINLDAAGVSYVPAEALSLVAEAANGPVVISTETFLGRGAVGGYLLTPGAVGQDAAGLALRVLGGEHASSIGVSANSVNRPIFDWRQLQRWGIPESVLPVGSEVRYRELSVSEQYWWQIALVIAALCIQSALIIGLVYEHRRRRNAEAASLVAVAKLADMNRVATAGELSASIAHEVSQPLTAMLSSANAALRWLARSTPDIEQARAALTRIVGSGQRAAEVIGSIRTMFKNEKQERTPVDLNALIQEVLRASLGELKVQGISVQTRLTQPLPLVLGHGGQLQQVVLNLVKNAAEAMRSVSDRPRVLTVTSQMLDGGVLMSVEDAGTGIDQNDMDRIFESFFTTKSQGMGMGLSICRSIIQAHGGRIWASTGSNHGAVFNFEVPSLDEVSRPEGVPSARVATA
jgi:signal transduction histidine kinase